MFNAPQERQFPVQQSLCQKKITSYPCLKYCIHCSTRHIYLANRQFHVLQIAIADKKDLYIFSYVIMYWNLCMGECDKKIQHNQAYNYIVYSLGLSDAQLEVAKGLTAKNKGSYFFNKWLDPFTYVLNNTETRMC